MGHLCKVVGKLFVFSFLLSFFYIFLSTFVYAESDLLLLYNKNKLLLGGFDKTVMGTQTVNYHFNSLWKSIKENLFLKKTSKVNTPKVYPILDATCGNNKLERGEVCDGNQGVKSYEICSGDCSQSLPVKEKKQFIGLQNNLNDNSKKPTLVDCQSDNSTTNEELYDLGNLPSDYPCISWPILPTITNVARVSSVDQFNLVASQPWTRIQVEEDLEGVCVITASDVEVIVEDGVYVESLSINKGVHRIRIDGGHFNEINIKAPVSFWPDYKVNYDWVVEDVVIENVDVRSSTYFALFGMVRRLAVLNSRFQSESSTFTSESPEGVMGENYIIAGNEFYTRGSLPNISISRVSGVVFIDNIVSSSNAFNLSNFVTDEHSTYFYIAKNQFIGTGLSLSNEMNWLDDNTFYHKRETLLDVNQVGGKLRVRGNVVFSDIADCLFCKPQAENGNWLISQNNINPYQEPLIEKDATFAPEYVAENESEKSIVAASDISIGKEKNEVRPFFIGHSLLNAYLPKMIHEIANSLGKSNGYVFDENYLTGVGASLSWHYNHPYDGQGADPFTELTEPNKYDALILTDAIPVNLFEEETKEFALRFFQLALQGNPDTDLFLFSAWVHKDSREFSDWKISLEEEIAAWERIRAYLAAETGKQNIYIIPGSYALRYLVEEADQGRVPGLENSDELFNDDFVHLNALGNYFMSLVHYASLYRSIPLGATQTTFSPFGKVNSPLPDEDMATVMQTIAWQVVLDYPFSGVKEKTGTDVLCSNGLLDNEEECDDGNQLNGDGCSSLCTFENSSEDSIADAQYHNETLEIETDYRQVDDSKAVTIDTPNSDSEQIGTSVNGDGDFESVKSRDDESVTDVAGSSSTYLEEETQPSSYGIGLNLSWNFDQVQQWMFVDAMKHARTWGTRSSTVWQGWNTEMNGEIVWRSDGYPVEIPAQTSKGPQFVFTVMLYNHELAESTWPAGEYTVFYEGDGELVFGGDATLVGQSSGRYTINVQPRSFVELQIRRSNPQNPIRNIQVIMPGFEKYYASNPFHPLFLERLGNVAGLKFTHTATTNFDENGSWDQRVTPNYFSQGTENGVALEYMVQLANLTQKDPWFNLPHRADDEYVKRYAEYLRDNLNPDLTIYLEYSNEVWNDAYIQSAWLRQKGCADTDTFIPFEGSKDSGVIGCDDFASGIKATAKRMVQIFDIFNHVFGDDSQRVVKIIGGNTQWYEYNDWLWGHFNDPIINPEGIKADAIAIAPYFARSQNISEIIQNESGEALTVDSILNFAADDLQTTVNSWFIHYGNWAQERNLQLLAYEGGNLLTYTERGPELAKKVEDASQHPRMGELYLEYFDQWRQAGGDLIMVNNYVGLPGYGATQGILEYQNQPLNEAYMYQAVMTAAGKNHKATVCGDGVAQTWEACDDGNTKDGDGCSKYCVIE